MLSIGLKQIETRPNCVTITSSKNGMRKFEMKNKIDMENLKVELNYSFYYYLTVKWNDLHVLERFTCAKLSLFRNDN